jgi:hypothetical protein
MLLNVSPSSYISTLFDNAIMAGTRMFCVRANHCRALKRCMLVDLCNVLTLDTKTQFEPNRQVTWRLPEIIGTTTEIYIVTRVACGLYSPLLGPGLLFCFIIFLTPTVGLLGWMIRSPEGRYLLTGHHTHRINLHRDLHDLSKIISHDPSVRASEDSSCLRPRGHCDGHMRD